LLCGGYLDVYLVVLHRVLRATTKKVVNFFEEKRAPPDKFFKVRAWALSLPIFATYCWLCV